MSDGFSEEWDSWAVENLSNPMISQDKLRKNRIEQLEKIAADKSKPEKERREAWDDRARLKQAQANIDRLNAGVRGEK